MGLEVVVEDERGRRLASVEDPTKILRRFLPPPDDCSFACLRYVDLYGDTMFNRLQMPDVVKELRRVLEEAPVEGEKELLDRIIGLAVQCQSAPHLYLRFYGD